MNLVVLGSAFVSFICEKCVRYKSMIGSNGWADDEYLNFQTKFDSAKKMFGLFFVLSTLPSEREGTVQ